MKKKYKKIKQAFLATVPLRGGSSQKIKILLLITHPHVVPNL